MKLVKKVSKDNADHKDSSERKVSHNLFLYLNSDDKLDFCAGLKIGDKGDQGLIGQKGEKGFQGPKGIIGQQGIQGPIGNKVKNNKELKIY